MKMKLFVCVLCVDAFTVSWDHFSYWKLSFWQISISNQILTHPKICYAWLHFIHFQIKSHFWFHNEFGGMELNFKRMNDFDKNYVHFFIDNLVSWFFVRMTNERNENNDNISPKIHISSWNVISKNEHRQKYPDNCIINDKIRKSSAGQKSQLQDKHIKI